MREGSDITLVSAMKSVDDCLEAAERLAGEGISAEVIDLQTIRPLDADTVLRSLAKTNRIAVVEEGPRTGGWAGEVLAVVDRAGARRHRRRLADHDAGRADPLQPAARGRLPARAPSGSSRRSASGGRGRAGRWGAPRLRRRPPSRAPRSLLEALTGSPASTLPTLLRARAVATPDAVFLHWQGASWS